METNAKSDVVASIIGLGQTIAAIISRGDDLSGAAFTLPKFPVDPWLVAQLVQLAKPHMHYIAFVSNPATD